MHKRPFQLLILLLWFSLLSLAALAGDSAAQEPNHPAATDQAETGVWDQTREAGSNAIESGQELGSAAAEKSRQIYLTVKEKGSAAGEVIADTSRTAWKKTRQAGAVVAEKAGALGDSIAEKSKSLYRQATQPAQRSDRQDI
ncbi:hypothetical protein [Sedimenticola hydrogenitrophicus]|uniref:hypothetical protein n=1 Tax=Sedimenticola hydrogenitrophicus TaxID=2967975 RepID=UPI0023B1CE8E|nr:hypothetical protein [Sedimenticola hydrogenitrophicus]